MSNALSLLTASTLIVLAGLSAAAETDAEWRPTQANDPTNEACRKIWQDIGLPRYTTPGGDKTTVCHDRYVLSHDNASKTPDWVVELLTKAKLTNKFGRPDTIFSPDPRTPPRGRPVAGDYANNADKFEIGHMAPSEDFNNSIVNMRDTFYFSNAVPQAGRKFNAASWKTLETEVRNATKASKKLYVITGTVRGDGVSRTIKIAKADNACGGAIELDAIATKIACKAVNTGQATRCSTGVVVPVALYKIAYDPDRNAAFGFIMPNRNHKTGLGRPYLQEWRVHIGAIENLTGLQFFTGLPVATRERLVQQCETTQLWAPAKPKKNLKKKKKSRPLVAHL